MVAVRRRRPVVATHLVAAGGMAITISCTDDHRAADSSGGNTAGETTGAYSIGIAYPIAAVYAISPVGPPPAPPPDPNNRGPLPQGCWPLCTPAQIADPGQAHACAHPAPGSAVGSPGTSADFTACCPATSSADPGAEGCPAGSPSCPTLCTPAAEQDDTVPKQCNHARAGGGATPVSGAGDPGACCPAAAAVDPNLSCP